ncbi:MAG: hypothetical protein GWN93_05750 [Deltaproteobacteria bacterium]|nr:hypothetical protein [Deltaproteobacteria bacterium]
MAFNVESTRVPTSIGDVYVTLADYAEATDTVRGIVEVRDQNGDVMQVWTGSLVPHLTSAQISGLQSFMASLRSQAEDQLLP